MKKLISITLLCVLSFLVSNNVSGLEIDRTHILDDNINIILVIDPDTGDIVFVNKAAVTFYGYSKEELLTMNIKDFNMLSDEEVEIEMEAAMLEARDHFHFVHLSAKGERFVTVYSYPITVEGKVYLFSTIFDVTEDIIHREHDRNILVGFVTSLGVLLAGSVIVIILFAVARSRNKRLQQELVELANHDVLTGLCNRMFFDQFLKKEISRAERTKDVFTVAMFDIDAFKKINDTFGHPVGDLFLQDFASLMKKVFREEDLIARWGGDEFIVLFPHTKATEVKTAIERMSYENSGVHYMDDLLEYTFSVGIHQYKIQESFEDIIAGVDEKLYKDK